MRHALALAALTALLAACTADGSGDRTGATPSPTSSLTSSPTSATSPATPAGSPAPAELAAAVTRAGRLVLVDATTGTVRRDLGPTPAYDVALAPDGSTVWLTDTDPATRHGRVRRLDVATGRVTDVGAFSAPAVSPDGRTVALVDVRTGALVLQDLATGRRRTFPARFPEVEEHLGAVRWTPQPDRLVLFVGGVEGALRYAVFDAARHREVREATPLPGRVSWHADYHGRDLLLTELGRCHDEADCDDDAVARRNPSTGRLERLVDVPERAALSLTANGRAVLWLGRDGALWRWDGSAAPRRLGGAYQLVDW